MAIVSISEAARITGKARSTIQSYIKTGKLSKTTDSHTGAVGVDISELVRCFGELTTTPEEHVVNTKISHQTTGITTPNTTDEITKIAVLEKEIELLKKVIEEKDEHNKSLKQAMLLLEHKAETKKENRSWFSRLFNK
ncbi:Hypothetical protein F387_01983 [Wohlfahrtiimonas chitiniclastica SH04]|uniref:Entry exclusion protein 1 n=1 Tax=Wohlfahrtiimonas chitiniclastica SH04 TaxID=1261130 RepID=L8XWR8_9GAMM|nr:hypothetical protein [Wohlfahrtiimonas chitiniclastica]ELV07200.1 Hypothetical protein F387_01983 [Wohlfahrtiimonas chitiniclastica SH04]